MLKNTSTRYGLIAKYLHWSMALFFIFMFTIAYIMINMSRSPMRESIYSLHKATGLLLFVLVSLRLIWRFLNAQPRNLDYFSNCQRWLAKGNILLLYGLMFIIPISGFLTSTLGNHVISFYGIFRIEPLANNKMLSTMFSNFHEVLTTLLLIAFILHIMGALYHHFFLKDKIFSRMSLFN